jgi:plastocyanin
MVKRRREHKGRNLAFLVSIGTAVVLLLWFSMPSGQVQSNMPDADVHLTISMAGWSPAQFAAKAGQPTTVMLMTLASEAGMSDNVHTFILNETNTDVRVLAGQSTTFTITFPHPGTYTFWCTTCCGGTKSPDMAGKVTVT